MAHKELWGVDSAASLATGPVQSPLSFELIDVWTEKLSTPH